MTNLKHTEFMINKHSKTSHGNQQEFYAESVMVTVVRCAELLVHEVYCDVQREDEDHFHDRVVHRHEYCEQVEISRREHDGKHDLRFA